MTNVCRITNYRILLVTNSLHIILVTKVIELMKAFDQLPSSQRNPRGKKDLEGTAVSNGASQFKTGADWYTDWTTDCP